MKQIGMVLFLTLLLINILSGCEKQETNINLANIDVSDIEKIEQTGTTGGKNGSYTYTFSDNESNDFVDLLNQVELGNEVDENKALSSGAVSYYTLYFKDGKTLLIRPGQYFKIENTYYKFKNYDELWDGFIEVNSIH